MSHKHCAAMRLPAREAFKSSLPYMFLNTLSLKRSAFCAEERLWANSEEILDATTCTMMHLQTRTLWVLMVQ
eukprot:3369809-Amphidinium_carterae.1